MPTFFSWSWWFMLMFFIIMVVHVHVCSWPWWVMRILFNVHAGSCPCYVISIVVSSHGLCTYTHVFMMLLSMLLLIKAAHVHSLFSFPARLAAQRARVLWACACLLISWCQVHVQVRVHHSDLICSDDSGNSSAAGFGRFCGWLSARPFLPPIYRFQKYTFPGVFLRKWLFRRGFVEESPLQVMNMQYT